MVHRGDHPRWDKNIDIVNIPGDVGPFWFELSGDVVVLVVKLVCGHSCVADRLPVVVRFPAGPRVRLKTVDPPKGNGLGQKKMNPSVMQRICPSIVLMNDSLRSKDAATLRPR